jgi:hypothetical protein
MPTSFGCQRSSPDATAIGISAPGGARIRFGAEPAKKPFWTIKKPGFERRAIPSIPWATHSLRPLGRMCSMLDCFLSGVGNQPHLILVGRPGPSADFPANPGSANIRRVYQNPKFRQVAFKIFLCPVHKSHCEFHRPCGNPRNLALAFASVAPASRRLFVLAVKV